MYNFLFFSFSSSGVLFLSLSHATSSATAGVAITTAPAADDSSQLGPVQNTADFTSWKPLMVRDKPIPYAAPPQRSSKQKEEPHSTAKPLIVAEEEVTHSFSPASLVEEDSPAVNLDIDIRPEQQVLEEEKENLEENEKIADSPQPRSGKSFDDSKYSGGNSFHEDKTAKKALPTSGAVRLYKPKQIEDGSVGQIKNHKLKNYLRQQHEEKKQKVEQNGNNKNEEGDDLEKRKELEEHKKELEHHKEEYSQLQRQQEQLLQRYRQQLEQKQQQQQQLPLTKKPNLLQQFVKQLEERGPQLQQQLQPKHVQLLRRYEQQLRQNEEQKQQQQSQQLQEHLRRQFKQHQTSMQQHQKQQEDLLETQRQLQERAQLQNQIESQKELGKQIQAIDAADVGAVGGDVGGLGGHGAVSEAGERSVIDVCRYSPSALCQLVSK